MIIDRIDNTIVSDSQNNKQRSTHNCLQP